MRVEISRINGDIYINGTKAIFACDFNNPPTAEPQYNVVDWLLGWAKLGMLSRGNNVTHFEIKEIGHFHAGPELPGNSA